MKVLLAALFCFTAAIATTTPDNPIEQLQLLVNSIDGNATLKREFDKHFEEWRKLDTAPSVPKFDCSSSHGRSLVKPNSVHELRPGDIDVVAALGDSITAGCGSAANTAAGILLEWRGRSWSIGGDKSVDEGVFTLPNLIKKFNPKVKGFSTGVIPVLSQGIFRKQVGYNMAVSGAVSRNMMTQARLLIERMREDKNLDMDKDWKLVTLFIGGNDLCAYCKNESAHKYSTYGDNLKQTLNYLQQNLPRTMVNVVLMLDLTQLSEINNGFVCSILHRLFCKCGSYPDGLVAQQAMVEEAVEYSEAIINLLQQETAFDKGDDFTVVAQPFLVNQRLPTTLTGKPDLSYFAPDCFHFSVKGHAASAQALWNNMFQPAGRKRLSWFVKEGWNCPTSENPFIFTYRNSGTFNRRPQQTGNGLKNTEEFGESERNFGKVKQPEMAKEKATEHKSQDAHSIKYTVAPIVVGVCATAIIIIIIGVMIKSKHTKEAMKRVDEKTGLL